MIQRILVPTDGSALSEGALPLAETLARAQQAEVVFAQVIELPRWVGTEPEGYISADVYDDLVRALEEEARRNLDTLLGRFQQVGLSASSVQREGSPSIALLEIEKEQRPDLVVIGSHGRSGLARFALGSVADRLVREGSVPVLLARSFGEAATELRGALVPLDGSPVAEEALPLVEQLAGKPLHNVRLLRAVRSAEERAAASEYLDQAARKLKAAGLQVEVEVRVENPAAAIKAVGATMDLVIMATHGRGGIDRLRHGSVAEGATRDLGVPVLLVRAGAREQRAGDQSPAARAGS